MGNCCQRCLTDRSLEETRSKGVSTESYEYSNRFDVLESEKVESPTWFQQFTPNIAEIRPQSQVYYHKVSLSVPVCTVGNERPSTFTTLELIRRELNKVFPDIAVKEKDQNGDVALVNQWQERTKDAIEESGQITPSIETCIECMKKNPDDFSKQLIYSEHIGTLAEQESLSFLLCKSDAITCLLTALKTFPDKLELNLTVFPCLLKLASVSAANCSHIVEHDGVSVIKNTLRRFTDSPELLRLVLRTTKFISAAEELVATLSCCDLHCEIFQALYRHTADRDVVMETCYILGNLLFAEKTGQQLLRFGGLYTIISLVEKYSDDVTIMENVCRVLGCFANNDQTHLAVCQAGATQVIVKVLTSAISSVSVFESSLWALACLTVSESTCQDVVAFGGVDTVLNILTEHPQCELVQLYGTRTLYNISTFDSTVKFVSTEPVAFHLAYILSNYTDNLMLLELVMVTSSHIVLENESIHRPLMEKHYVSEIVKLMTSFPENKTIQDQGCKIIGNLAVRGDLRKLVENEGASKAIVAAMLALEEIREIQEIGCLALVNLTCNCRVNKIRAIQCGAVTTILQTISGFKKEMTLAVCALKALSTLVTEDEACHQILENGGLHLLKSLVDGFQRNSDILSDTALVLSRLAVLPAVQSIHLNIIDTLLSSIWSLGQKDDHVVHTLCHSFENLSKTDSGRKLLATNQRLDIVLHMMSQHTQSTLIQSTGCRIIAMISLYVSNKESILTETAVKCVLSSMELFPLDFDVILVGCVTLTCIIQQMEKMKEKCLAFGGVSRIEQAVSSHTNDPRLALVAVLALGQLMPIDSQKYPKESYLACSIILSCLNRFINNKDVWIAGCQALSETVLSDSCLADVKKIITKMPRQLNCDPEIRVVIDKIFRTQNTTIIRL